MKIFTIVFVWFNADSDRVLNFFNDMLAEDLVIAGVMTFIGVVIFNNVRKQEEKQNMNASSSTRINKKIEKTPSSSPIPRKIIKEGFTNLKSEIKTALNSVKNKHTSKDGTLRFADNFTYVFIESEGSDFSGDIVAISPDRNYFFAYGDCFTKKSENFLTAIALVTKEDKVFLKKFSDDPHIEDCILSNDGMLFFFEDTIGFCIITHDGTQKNIEIYKNLGIDYENKYFGLGFDYCYAYGRSDILGYTLWIYDVVNKDSFVKTIDDESDIWEFPNSVNREGTIISICANDKKIVFDLISKSFQ